MKTDRNCLSYWFPKLQASGVPVPETHIVRTEAELMVLLGGQEPEEYLDFLNDLARACVSVGFPAFLRTGQGSGKHEWSRTCCVQDLAELESHVAALVEWSELVDFFGLPTDVWAVRRFLDLESSFTAFRDFPVNKERRYFIRDGKVVCQHPYWPEAAIAEGVEGGGGRSLVPKRPVLRPGTPADWRERLATLNHQTPEEVAHLTALSEQVARHFEGAWSLDWACDRQGQWWAIDMAQAAQSFHWPECPHAAERVT